MKCRLGHLFYLKMKTVMVIKCKKGKCGVVQEIKIESKIVIDLDSIGNYSQYEGALK